MKYQKTIEAITATIYHLKEVIQLAEDGKNQLPASYLRVMQAMVGSQTKKLETLQGAKS